MKLGIAFGGIGRFHKGKDSTTKFYDELAGS